MVSWFWSRVSCMLPKRVIETMWLLAPKPSSSKQPTKTNLPHKWAGAPLTMQIGTSCRGNQLGAAVTSIASTAMLPSTLGLKLTFLL